MFLCRMNSDFPCAIWQQVNKHLRNLKQRAKSLKLRVRLSKFPRELAYFARIFLSQVEHENSAQYSDNQKTLE